MDPKPSFLTVPFSVDVGRPPKTARSRQNPYQKSPQIFFGGSGPKKSIFGVPTWPPKSYQNPLRGVPGALPVPKGRPEPSGEPFWKHFGSILAPFWCNFWHQLGRPAIAAKPSRNRSKTAATQQRHSSETAATQQQHGRAGQQAPG